MDNNNVPRIRYIFGLGPVLLRRFKPFSCFGWLIKPLSRLLRHAVNLGENREEKW
jgi:hypothetical protein